MDASAHRRRKIEISIREKRIMSKEEYDRGSVEYLQYLYSLLAETGNKDVIDKILRHSAYGDAGKIVRVLALRHYYETASYFISVRIRNNVREDILYLFLSELRNYEKSDVISFIKGLGIKSASNNKYLCSAGGVQVLSLLLEAGVEINFSELLSSPYLIPNGRVERYLNNLIENEV